MKPCGSAVRRGPVVHVSCDNIQVGKVIQVLVLQSVIIFNFR